MTKSQFARELEKAGQVDVASHIHWLALKQQELWADVERTMAEHELSLSHGG